MAKYKYYDGINWVELFPASGGDISGHIYLTGANASSSTASTSQLVFGTAANNHVAVSSNAGALVINPSTASTTGQIVMYVGNNPKIEINGNEVATQVWVGQQNYLTSASLGTAAALNYTTSVTSGSGDLVTSGAVYSAIAGLPQPMVFQGTIGTNGTIEWSQLPNASDSVGWTYKAISTNANLMVKAGDTIVSNGSEWVVIPSGDEPSGTVTNVALSMPSIFTVTNSPVTSTGTLTATLNNQSANTVFAGPASGSAAAPTFRALVAADIPALNYVPYTGATGNVDLGNNLLSAGGGVYAGEIHIYDVTSNDTTTSYITTGNTDIVINPDGHLYYGNSLPQNEVATKGNLGDYLPLSGGTVNDATTFNTNTNTTPLVISRDGSRATECVALGVDDGCFYNTYTNDEYSSAIRWTLVNTDTEASNGSRASTHYMQINSSNTGASLYMDGDIQANYWLISKNLSIINDYSDSGYDAMVYFRNRSNADWAQIIDCEGAEYGLDIKCSNWATYALRTNGGVSIANGNLNMNGCSIINGDGSGNFYYRTNNDLKAGFYYQTNGDESVVFANQYAGAGWMFVNGINIDDRPNWQGLTPTLQIKRGGVAINKLIGQAVSPDYNLDVNGSVNATTVTINTKATMQYNATDDCLDFIFV